MLVLSELRMRRLSLALWAVGVLVLVAAVIAVYPSVRDSPSLNSIYGDLSPAAQGLLGGSDLTSPTGYLSTQLFAFFVPVVLLVFALGRGAAAIAGEEEDHTLDLLIAQPLARRRAYGGKAVAVLACVAALVVAIALPLLTLNSATGLGIPIHAYVALLVDLGLFCAALAMAAQALAAAAGRRAVGVAGVAAYAFVSYLVFGLADTVTWLRPVRPASLWRWYLGDDPLHQGLVVTDWLVLAAVAAAAAMIGTVAFRRRDLRA